MREAPTYPLGGHRLLVGMLAAAALGFAAIGWVGDTSAPGTVQVLNSVPLFDDDHDDGMFALAAMAPDTPVTRCLRIGYDGEADAGPVRLAAAHVAGRLADDLAVTVDRGSTGGYGDCTGFAGSRIYTGTLAGLAAAGSGSGVSTEWQPHAGESRAFRITVTLTAPSPPAPGDDAQADFVWQVASTATPTTPPTAAPTSTTPTSTAPTSTAPTSEAPTSVAPTSVAPTSDAPRSEAPTSEAPSVAPTSEAPASEAPAGATPASEAPASQDPSPSDGAVPAAEPAGGHGAAPGPVRRALEPLAKLAREALRHAAIPVVLIAALVLFLFLQGAADRRDPKLALAPVWRSRYVWIPPGRKAGK